MNKLIRFLILSVFIITFLNCETQKKTIIINQLESKKPIIVRLTMEDSTILGIKFPNKIEINNNSFSKKSFKMIDYKYMDPLTRWRNLGIGLYKIEKQELEHISNNQKKTILMKSSLEFIYYTRHFLDSSNTIQQQFKPYIKKMLKLNQDTLHIGTVSEFKQKHKELLKQLTKNDSISIQFLENGKFGERITVPAKW